MIYANADGQTSGKNSWMATLGAIVFVVVGATTAGALTVANETAKLVPSDPESLDEFGFAIAIDGDTIVVGAPSDDDACPADGNCNSGSAYVFQRDQGGPGAWGEVAKLVASNTARGDEFGFAVAIDGDTIIVGAMGADGPGNNAGAVYIFERDQGGANAWGELLELNASDASASDFFGSAVGVSGDTVVVGAKGESGNTGAAYVFARDPGSIGNWSEVVKLTAADADSADHFGQSVAIDLDSILVGSDFDDDLGGMSGAAFVFERDAGGPGVWGQVAKLLAGDGAADDQFGFSVDIEGDHAVVGAPFHDGPPSNTGAAYLFERDEGGANAWGQVAQLTASDAQFFDVLGLSVATSLDRAVAGSPLDDGAANAAGAAYAFERDEGGPAAWRQSGEFVASDPVASAIFGRSVGLSGNTLVVGAEHADSTVPVSGAAYVLELETISAPFAADDNYTMEAGDILFEADPGVLGNDFDPEGDPLTAELRDSPIDGDLTLNADGSFTYTPDPGFVGADTFTYIATDGASQSLPATVSVTVTEASPDLVITGLCPGAITVEISEATPNGLIALLTSTSEGSDTVQANRCGGTQLGLDQAAFLLDRNVDGGGELTLTPTVTTEHCGLFVQAVDAETCQPTNVAQVPIDAVNDPPEAQNDAFGGTEDTPLVVAAPGVLANDSDPNGDNLEAMLITGPSNGELILNADGGFTYTPNADFNGTDSFVYAADDGDETSAPATATLTIGAAPDDPVALDDAFATDEDTLLAVVAPGVLENDSDPDGDGLTAVLDTGPSSGTLTLLADGSFTYEPEQDFNGVDSFTYHADDGTSPSNTATVTLTVAPINDAPVAEDQPVTTAEDTPVVTVLGASDVDGDPLTFTIETPPTNGTLDLAFPNVTYTPDADFNGADSFTFSASDGELSATGTVTITITPVNDTPVAEDQSVTTAEDTPVVIVLGASDVDGDPLVFTIETPPTNGTLDLAFPTVTYTPDADFNGADSFTFSVHDGTVDSNVATVSITVDPGNDPPLALDDPFGLDEDETLTVTPPGVLGNDSDPDGDGLTAVLDTGPSSGTLTLLADGSFTYEPDPDFNGTDSFTYHADDGTSPSNTATVTLTVAPINDAPVAEDQPVTTAEDTPVVIVLGASDVDGDPLVFTIETPPTNGTLDLAFPTVTYTPDADFNGADSFTFSASDGELSATGTVTITITPVNDAPVADDQSVTTAQDVPLPITLTGSDVDGDPLTYAAGTPGNGTLSGVAPNVTYTPNPGFNGADSFTFSVNDGMIDSNVATVSITVSSPGASPLASRKKLSQPTP